MNPEEKLYIFELGTGSGKLSFFMLKALQELSDTLPLALDKIVYVVTDIAEDNLNFWEEHPALQSFISQGRVDFGIFDAINDTEVFLKLSQKTITPSSLKIPWSTCIRVNI